MRVLLLNYAMDIDNPFWGFATRWVEELARRVDHIEVIPLWTGRVEAPSNVTVHQVRAEEMRSDLRRAAHFYQHLWRVTRDSRIDVCFSHMILILPLLAAPILKAKKIPLVTWFAHVHLPGILKITHALADRVVSSIPTAYPYRRDKLVTIGAGIDTDLFSPDGRPPDDPPMILCVGRLSPSKDHATLLHAVAALRKRRGPRFQVAIVGDPAAPRDRAYAEMLHGMVSTLGLDDCVRFEPGTSVVRLPDWYRRCALHVNLTPTGFGDKVALEAMACGRPSILANEGFRETLGRYADELMFPYGDAAALADRLEHILSLSATERSAMEAYLSARVVQAHGLGATMDRLVAVLQSVTRDGG